ncbi:MAG: single-stranded DNA-binding protein [Candidatus Omnitrophica bacterium]|nr:single-stranded DNA-binding protein [Candidatus Omnitrophota bacterium]
MAASLNSVFLIGNLTRDPELRYIPSGQAVATFTLAMNRTYMAKTGEKKEEASFIRVVVWAKRAEVCHEYLRKGSSVFVEGRLQSRTWDAPDGTKRSTIEVVAENVQFLGRPMAKQAGSEAPVQDIPEREEAIIDDSFNAESKTGSIGVSKEELRPDNEVPF